MLWKKSIQKHENSFSIAIIVIEIKECQQKLIFGKKDH